MLLFIHSAPANINLFAHAFQYVINPDNIVAMAEIKTDTGNTGVYNIDIIQIVKSIFGRRVFSVRPVNCIRSILYNGPPCINIFHAAKIAGSVNSANADPVRFNLGKYGVYHKIQIGPGNNGFSHVRRNNIIKYVPAARRIAFITMARASTEYIIPDRTGDGIQYRAILFISRQCRKSVNAFAQFIIAIDKQRFDPSENRMENFILDPVVLDTIGTVNIGFRGPVFTLYIIDILFCHCCFLRLI
jgi:hypothetical protein